MTDSSKVADTSILSNHSNTSNVPRSHGINSYSFALKPEEHQPTGTCNMSRIDNVTLIMQLNGVDQVRPLKSESTLLTTMYSS